MTTEPCRQDSASAMKVALYSEVVKSTSEVPSSIPGCMSRLSRPILRPHDPSKRGINQLSLNGLEETTEQVHAKESRGSFSAAAQQQMTLE
jgi:hypothetical protein